MLIGTIRARGSCLIGALGSHLIKARGYGSCLIGAREISACLIGVVDRCLWIGVKEISACACDRDGMDLDREGELIQKWV